MHLLTRIASFTLLALLTTTSAQAARDSSSINWGDDSSQWSNDGECDDPRFEGPGAHPTNLEADRFRDATDCRTLYEQGRIHMVESGPSSPAPSRNNATQGSAGINWGDDSSQWSNDGECDDPRFEGPGAHPTNLEADRFRDATDCRTLYEQGRIHMVE
jgi:hypothetical protein